MKNVKISAPSRLEFLRSFWSTSEEGVMHLFLASLSRKCWSVTPVPFSISVITSIMIFIVSVVSEYLLHRVKSDVPCFISSYLFVKMNIPRGGSCLVYLEWHSLMYFSGELTRFTHRRISSDWRLESSLISFFEMLWCFFIKVNLALESREESHAVSGCLYPRDFTLQCYFHFIASLVMLSQLLFFLSSRVNYTCNLFPWHARDGHLFSVTSLGNGDQKSQDNLLLEISFWSPSLRAFSFFLQKCCLRMILRQNTGALPFSSS